MYLGLFRPLGALTPHQFSEDYTAIEGAASDDADAARGYGRRTDDQQLCTSRMVNSGRVRTVR